MSTALVLTDRVRQEIQLTTKQNVLEIQLGDGYREVTADGINSERQMWANMGWDNLSSSERTTALGFLATVKSTGYITWTPPGFSSKRFRITKDGWSEKWVSGTHSCITFTLQEE